MCTRRSVRISWCEAAIGISFRWFFWLYFRYTFYVHVLKYVILNVPKLISFKLHYARLHLMPWLDSLNENAFNKCSSVGQVWREGSLRKIFCFYVQDSRKGMSFLRISTNGSELWVMNWSKLANRKVFWNFLWRWLSVCGLIWSRKNIFFCKLWNWSWV